MTRRSRKDEMEFIGILRAELPNVEWREVEQFARLLMRHSATHQRMAEEECCVEMSERQAAWHEKRTQQVEARITVLCTPYGIVPDFQGDPRGATVKLKVPSGRTNDWGQTGICVP